MPKAPTATPVIMPLRFGNHLTNVDKGTNVNESDTGPRKDSIGQIKLPKLTDHGSEHQSAAVHQYTESSYQSWSYTILKTARKHRSKCKDENRDRIGQKYFGSVPSECIRKGLIKKTPRVNTANAHLNKHSTDDRVSNIINSGFSEVLL
jgi:hypothetical protein